MKRKELETLSKDELIDLILQLQDEKPIGWHRLRELVWERDDRTCQVCGLNLRKIKAWYDCGHIVDRLRGGTDELSNLVVMCAFCNQAKPLHDTKDEYMQWLRSGYWKQEYINDIKAYLDDHKGEIEEFAPSFNPSNTTTLLAIRQHQLAQLRVMTGQPKNPKREWLNEHCCEWKQHQ